MKPMTFDGLDFKESLTGDLCAVVREEPRVEVRIVSELAMVVYVVPGHDIRRFRWIGPAIRDLRKAVEIAKYYAGNGSGVQAQA